jgi:hypothetical protein
MMSSIFLPGCSLSWSPYIDGCFSSGSVQSIRILRVLSLAVPLSKTQDRRRVEGHAIDAQGTSLVLARAAPEDLLAVAVLLPTNAAAAMSFFIGFFL